MPKPKEHPLTNLHSNIQLAEGIRYLNGRIDEIDARQRNNFSYLCAAINELRKQFETHTHQGNQ